MKLVKAQYSKKEVQELLVLFPGLFKTSDTDLNFWLDKCQKFAWRFLRAEVSLHERFAIPPKLPWKSVIPIFDPGWLTNQDAVQRALENSGLLVEGDVMRYSGSRVGRKPTLHLIQNSIRPDKDTMGMSPNGLTTTGKNWLSLRSYVLAFGLHHFATGKYLDPKTFTWFPNARLEFGETANGHCDLRDHIVRFNCNGRDCDDRDGGSRLAIPVPSIP